MTTSDRPSSARERLTDLQAELKAKQLEYHTLQRKVGVTPDERLAALRIINRLFDAIADVRANEEIDTEPPF